VPVARFRLPAGDGLRTMAATKLPAWLAIPAICLGAVLSPAGVNETAQSADAFVDSVGVDVHLHFTDTPYASFAGVETALKGLGVRHIRDGLIDTTWTPYYDRLNELGRLGIKSALITSPSESDTVLAGYPRRVPDSFEAYEAPNEYDQRHGLGWAATLNSFMARLYGAVKSDPITSRFPIIGPSLTRADSFPKVAESARFFDYANLHNYFGGRNPGTPGWGGNGYGSFAWNLVLAREAWPGKPIITTETGYINDLSNQQGIPEDVSGKYLPRLLLEQWMHGIQRTYLYELLDLGNKERFRDNSFGLVHSDFTPKAGYSAIQALLQLFSDPGPAFKLDQLNFSLSGDLANVHHLLLEKRNGTFYLVLWVEQPGYDVNAKTYLHVATHEIGIHTGESMRIEAHELDDQGLMHTTNLGTTRTQVVNTCDRVTVLEMSR
jgi:hypothetical protein